MALVELVIEHWFSFSWVRRLPWVGWRPGSQGRRSFPLYRLRPPKARSEVATVNVVSFDGYTVQELESGTISVERDGASVTPAKPALREIAGVLNIPLVNSNGNLFNTRQLGSQVIRAVQASMKNAKPAHSRACEI